MNNKEVRLIFKTLNFCTDCEEFEKRQKTNEKGDMVAFGEEHKGGNR